MATIESLRKRVISHFITMACGWHILYTGVIVTEFIGESLMTFLPSVPHKLYRHIVIFIYSCASTHRFHFRYLRTCVCVCACVCVRVCLAKLRHAPYRRFNGHSARLHAVYIVIGQQYARERVTIEKSLRLDLIWVMRKID